MQHIISVKHVYQDSLNPHVQTILVSADYAIVYALFMSLIGSGKDFKVKIATDEEIED